MILGGNRFFWALLFSLLSLEGMAQNTMGALKGYVKDAETGEPLVGVGVTVVGTYSSALTDPNGFYHIPKLPAGDYSLKFQVIGYGTTMSHGITIGKGVPTVFSTKLSSKAEALQTVTVTGRKSQVDLEKAASEITLKREEIAQLNVRNVEDVVAMQAGVVKTTDGIQIRGARVYETEYLVDGISAQDPLAGTGFGVKVSSSSIQSLAVMTGGAGAEFGGGSSGVINTKIREATDKFEMSGQMMRDYLRDPTISTSFFTDIAEVSLGFPVPGTRKKITFFTNGTAHITDDYFPNVANQLKSSLFPSGPEKWAPRQTNSWTQTMKLAWQIKSGTKLTLTNQHSLNINQNTRTLQIVGFDALLSPGYQYLRSNNLDNATTYTHHSNLMALNLNHLISKKWGLTASVGRLFTNLRADANGRPFRTPTVDQILDEDHIVTSPVSLFNPNDPSGIYYVQPGNGLVNNNGISPVWHDHYAEEYTFRVKITHRPANNVHKLNFGSEYQINNYQWVDVSRPWVGAPIQINDSTFTPSVSIGSSNDIWRVSPHKMALFVEDEITYKGIIATLGMRFNGWAPGQFADDAINNPDAPVVDQIRADYLRKTISLGGLRWKARLLPRVNVSFPVTANNVLYFNYGHSMRLPHPRFSYAGLDPVYQDRSFLSFLGNPDLDPEVNVSYEVGYKASVNKNLGFTFSAFNNNRFDYIVSRKVLVRDQTGRQVSKTMHINQDYAKVQGVEWSVQGQLTSAWRMFGNVAYQVARGKSNSARESALQIEQNGEVKLSREQFLAWDRPWNINWGTVLAPIKGRWRGLEASVQSNYTSGFRYTPQKFTGYNDLGRPQYQVLTSEYLTKKAAPWLNTDARLSYTLRAFKKRETGVTLQCEVRNLFNQLNSQIINPITGRAYEYGDDAPTDWRDPRPEFNGPQESGLDPRDPSRYTAPRQILFGITFKL